MNVYGIVYALEKSFTLLEVLVVIAIVGILMILLLPSLNNARQQAKEILCLANLNQIYSGS